MSSQDHSDYTTPRRSYPTTSDSNNSITPQNNLITRRDVIVGGNFLLILSVISLLVNLYLLWLVVRNWKVIKKSAFFNTNVLCLMLAVADMAFALLVALPAGIHMAWVDVFRRREGMMFYSQYTGYILFEYLFLLRVVLIAVLTTDRGIHVIRPIHYTRIVTRNHLNWIIITVLGVPLVFRAIPNILNLKLNHATSLCEYYLDDAGFNDQASLLEYRLTQIVPLTCVSDGSGKAAVTEIIIGATFTIISWILITISNAVILIIALNRAYSPGNRTHTTEKARKTRRKLMKGAFLVVTISVTFCITNFPYVYIWLADYLYSYLYLDPSKTSDVTRFYLTLLIFLSLLFNPWMYLLRMRTIRTVLPSIKQTFGRSPKTSKTSQLTGSPQFRPV